MEREARSKKINKRKETDTRRADNSGRAVKGVGLDLLNTGIVGSKTSQDIYVCLRLSVLYCPDEVEG